MPHQDETLGLQLPSLRAPVGIAPTGSPFTYQASTSGTVMVAAGTVTIIEWGRGGVFTITGLLAAMVPVSAGDSVRVTYAVAPTMTFIAR